MNANIPPLVTLEDERPAGKGSGRCFYCPSKIGDRHALDCVIFTKKVIVRMTVEYEVEVPHSWGKDMIEFHRNDGTWCCDNALDELELLSNEGTKGKSCLCAQDMKFEFIKEVE